MLLMALKLWFQFNTRIKTLASQMNLSASDSFKIPTFKIWINWKVENVPTVLSAVLMDVTHGSVVPPTSVIDPGITAGAEKPRYFSLHLLFPVCIFQNYWLILVLVSALCMQWWRLMAVHVEEHGLSPQPAVHEDEQGFHLQTPSAAAGLWIFLLQLCWGQLTN